MPLFVPSTGGTPSGTSFPGSPGTSDRYYRTDRNIEYFYDGTRWLSTEIFTTGMSMTTQGVTGTTNYVLAVPYLPTYDCYLVSWDTVVYRDTAGEWDIVLTSLNASGTVTTIDTQDGSADASTTFINRSRALTTLLQASTTKLLRAQITEISGTAGLIASVGVNYRLVG